METITGKRPYRKRAPVESVHVEPEAGKQPEIDVGQGQTGEPGFGAQAHDAAEGQGIDWLELMAEVHAEKRAVVRCWHPEAKHDLAQLKNGANIEVKVGKAAYQLTTGEIVSL